MAAVRDACRAAGEDDPLDEAAELSLKHHGLARSALWIADAGFALVQERTLSLAVAPDVRRRGLGAILAQAALAGSAENGSADNGLAETGLAEESSDPGVEAAWAHGDHPAAARLAARFGFARVRELWVMRRSAADPRPELAVTPGVSIRSYRPEDAPALIAVNAAAFADHPEQGAMDDAGLAERMGEPWFDPAGLLLAVDDAGTLLGFHWTKQATTDVGEVYVVGVSPAAQGRGLGRVLTLAGLHHLVGRGVAEIELYVESDNAPAIAVYSRLGFTHAPRDTHVLYRRVGG